MYATLKVSVFKAFVKDQIKTKQRKKNEEYVSLWFGVLGSQMMRKREVSLWPEVKV